MALVLDLPVCPLPQETAKGNDIGLVLLRGNGCAVSQPLQTGIPLPSGCLRVPESLTLVNSSGEAIPLQTEILARWPDGSVKWLLLDALCPATLDRAEWRLRLSAAEDHAPLNCLDTNDRIVIDTRTAVFSLEKQHGSLLSQVTIAGRTMLSAEGLSLTLTDDRVKICRPIIDEMAVETRGPVRTTVRVAGNFAGRHLVDSFPGSVSSPIRGWCACG